MSAVNKNKITSLSLFNIALPKNGIDEFLDNSDSLWYSLEQYAKTNNFELTQIFTIRKDQLNTQEDVRQKGNSTFVFLRKKSFSVLIKLFKIIPKTFIVLHNNESFLDIIIGTIAKIAGAKVVFFFHNDKGVYENKLPRIMLKLFRNYIVDAFITNSIIIKNHFKKEINSPIYLFKFGYDSKIFYPIDKNEKALLRIIYCGRISPEKKIEDIIDGLIKAKHMNKLSFTLVGEDADPEQRYLNKIKYLLDKNHINYSHTGFIPHSKIVKYLHEADLFINLRPDEAFGKVFIEAMASGMPVIGRKNAPGPESLIINNFNGYLINSTDELALVVDKMVEDQPLRKQISENALTFVKNEYSLEKSYQSFKNAFDALAAGYFFEETFYRTKPLKTLRRIKRLILNQTLDRSNYIMVDGNLVHKEKYVLMEFCKGKGIDVGCGSNKTHPDAIGVDLTMKGMIGNFGNQKDQVSVADVCASGDNLYMFNNDELDYVVARHNIEHYKDTIKVLREWRRVVRVGGVIGIVIPDETYCDTIKLDPTHYHVFTPESFKNIVELIGGLKIKKLDTCVQDWSFYCIMEKVS
jgi:glycosyltransferase involved in cell wall biosynthesis